MHLYVIMPVASDPAYRLRRSRLEAAARAAGVTLRFPADEAENYTHASSEHLKRDLHACNAVIADLTLERPSCYYELGVAEGLGLKAFLIAEHGTQIHQVADRNAIAVYGSLEELAEVLAGLIAQELRLQASKT